MEGKMKKMLGAIFLLTPVVLYSSVISSNSPWGATLRFEPYRPDRWEWYGAALDSAISCGFSWIKPTGSPLSVEDRNGNLYWGAADSFGQIIKERNLNVIAKTWPCDTSEFGNPTHWYNYWHAIVDSLKDYVKYWNICMYPLHWLDGTPWHPTYRMSQAFYIDTILDSVATIHAGSMRRLDIDNTSVQEYWIRNADRTHRWLDSLGNIVTWDTLFNRGLNHILNYIKISAGAIHNADPEAKVCAIGLETSMLALLVKDKYGKVGFVEFMYPPPAYYSDTTLWCTPDSIRVPLWVHCILDSVGDSIDVFTHHYFDWIADTFDAMKCIKAVCDSFYSQPSHQPLRPVWVTEGCSFFAADSPVPGGVGVDSQTVLCEHAFSEWIERVNDPNDPIDSTDKFFYYTFMDFANEVSQKRGLLSNSLVPRPSYPAVKNIIHSNWDLFIENIPDAEWLKSDISEATAYNNGRKLVTDNTGNLHLVFTSTPYKEISPQIKYAMSDNGGASWKNKWVVGDGRYPSLGLDDAGKPAICWLQSTWLAGAPCTLWYYHPDLLSPFKLYDGAVSHYVSTPAIAVENNQVHVVLKLIRCTAQGYKYEVGYRTFPASNPPEGSNWNTDWEIANSWTSSELHLETLLSPSIDVDENGNPHIAYDLPSGMGYPFVYYANKLTGNWISEYIIDCAVYPVHPFIDAHYDKIDIVYERENDIWLARGMASSPGWTQKNISDTSAPSRSPQILDGVVIVWAEQQPEGHYDICYKTKTLYGGKRWSRVKSMSETSLNSRYPQIALESALPTHGYYLNCIWTEGDEASYEIKFARKFFSPVGKDYEGQELTVTSDTTLLGIHWNIDTFTINSGVTVSVASYDESDTTGMLEIHANTIIIEEGASLSASGCGYSGGEGPGSPSEPGIQTNGGGGAGSCASSGGHGNYCGGEIKPGGSAYADSSLGLGSGGANAVNTFGHIKSQGGCGGGKISLSADNEILIDGGIESNGLPGSSYWNMCYASGGGSAGSILITGNLSGSGTITCNGGDGGTTPSVSKGGGGSAGQVYIQYANSSFNGRIEVSGGNSGAECGQPGSMLIEQKDKDVVLLVSPVETEIGSHSRESFIKGVEFADKYVYLSANDSILGNVEMKALDYITIDSGAVISADEKGYNSAEGPGKGQDGNLVSGAGGAGFGGSGNSGSGTDGGAGGSEYGTADSCFPYSLGSGGGNGVSSMGEIKGFGGFGAGRIKIESHSLIVNGLISASGGNGTYYDCWSAGGGSGGSLWLIADTLLGSGILRADGGLGATASNCHGGGASGGRISLARDVDYFTDNGSISVAGGEGPPDIIADSGTICWTTKLSGGGTQSTDGDMPRVFKLHQNYPNPFVKSTTIQYQLPMKSKVSLKIYDVAGRCVKTLIDEEKGIGYYKVKWDGEGLSTGIYFAKFEAGDYKSTKKLILIR